MTARKRLYRVTGYDSDGRVFYQRDYQTHNAALHRKDVLLEGIDLPPIPPRDRHHDEIPGKTVDPASCVTITPSEVVVWPDEPSEVYTKERYTPRSVEVGS